MLGSEEQQLDKDAHHAIGIVLHSQCLEQGPLLTKSIVKYQQRVVHFSVFCNRLSLDQNQLVLFFFNPFFPVLDPPDVLLFLIAALLTKLYTKHLAPCHPVTSHIVNWFVSHWPMGYRAREPSTASPQLWPSTTRYETFSLRELAHRGGGASNQAARIAHDASPDLNDVSTAGDVPVLSVRCTALLASSPFSHNDGLRS
jgi:hypothetical protein